MGREFRDWEGEFEYEIGQSINSMLDEGWSKTRLAKLLRAKARELLPPKQKKRIIDPFKVSDKELSELPEDIQRQVRAIRRTAEIAKGALDRVSKQGGGNSSAG